MTYNFSCPNCGKELTADVDISEGIVDWEEECDCGYKFADEQVLKIYDEALAYCWSSWIDYVYDRNWFSL